MPLSWWQMLQLLYRYERIATSLRKALWSVHIPGALCKQMRSFALLCGVDPLFGTVDGILGWCDEVSSDAVIDPYTTDSLYQLFQIRNNSDMVTFVFEVHVI
jgi:hypothetical protein